MLCILVFSLKRISNTYNRIISENMYFISMTVWDKLETFECIEKQSLNSVLE